MRSPLVRAIPDSTLKAHYFGRRVERAMLIAVVREVFDPVQWVQPL